MIDRNAFKDTTMVYMFAFKVEVSYKSGLKNINAVQVSDHFADLIYKNFNFLKEIDYRVFMKNKKTATFIFPVSIFLSYPDRVNSGTLNGKDLQQKIERLWYRTAFWNSATEDFIYIPALN